jgi:hypothetical protein
MSKKFLVSFMSVLFIGALSVTAASAVPQPVLSTDSTELTPLRSVTSLPKNQPDALEFVGQMRSNLAGTVGINCTEVEIGTTVVGNNSLVKSVVETNLAVPFGVAEGDECTNAASGSAVPTYFDTSAAGAVPANIVITGGGPFIAELQQLKLSQNREKGFCTLILSGVKGEIVNPLGGLVEESPPNLEAKFGSSGIPVVCGKSKFSEIFSANFTLETPSTTTDTAWIGP